MMREEDLLAPDQEFIKRISDGFSRNVVPDPVDLLFPDDEDTGLSIWDDVDWWTGEAKDAKDASFYIRPPKKVYESEEFAEEAQMISENPELAKLPSYKEQTFPMRRWFKQENGKIPLDRMVKVGGSNYLRPDAAKAFRAMKRAARKDGVKITFSSSSQSGYRDYQTQVRLFNEKGDSDHGGLAADPGTSNHGWGMAIDIGPEAREWVAKNGSRFGFHGIQGESWHFDYKPDPNMDFKLPRPKKGTNRLVKPGPGRRIGAGDLTETVPLSEPANFTEAVLSLIHEERPVETVKGKRAVNLSDLPKPKERDDIVAWARTLAKQYGWTGKQWHALYELGQRESGWDPQAVNPDSGATGIPQLLPSAHDVPKNWKDPRVQIRWFLRYVNERYGGPQAALKFHDENGWY